MFLKKWKDYILKMINILQQYTDRAWYPALIGFLAALDNLVIIIPNDGILVSSSMLAPRRWFTFSTAIAIGSTVGAMVLAALVELQGLPWILEVYPGIAESKIWLMTVHFFEMYGALVVFIVALTPIMQHPAVILASLANIPLDKLALIIFFGRWTKFIIMAYVASHAPRYLRKMWGLKEELKEVGVNVVRSKSG